MSSPKSFARISLLKSLNSSLHSWTTSVCCRSSSIVYLVKLNSVFFSVEELVHELVADVQKWDDSVGKLAAMNISWNGWDTSNPSRLSEACWNQSEFVNDVSVSMNAILLDLDFFAPIVHNACFKNIPLFFDPVFLNMYFALYFSSTYLN